jgi:hypothetical protein
LWTPTIDTLHGSEWDVTANSVSLVLMTSRYDVIPRPSLTPLFDRTYSGTSTSKRDVVSPQELALLYMIFAMGALYSLELPPNDPVATEYFMLSKACLVKGNFMVNTAISGVQTLVSTYPSAC